MSACEKCWSDAYKLHINNTELYPTKTDAYMHLLKENGACSHLNEEDN